MTIAELKKTLNKIPKTGPINQARRRAILAQIYALMKKQE